MLLVVAAASAEAAPALRRLGASPPYSPPRLHSSHDGIDVLVAGIGADGEAPFLDALRQRRPAAAVNIGFAGALAAQLSPGDVVLASEWRDPDPPHAAGPAADRRLTAELRRRLGAAGCRPVELPAVTVDRPLHDVDRRDRLARDGGIGIVEMEGRRWAVAAHRAGVPFAAVRVVSDRADLRLPRYRELLLTPTGEVRWARALWALLRSGEWSRPLRRILQLRRAARDWGAACASLERVTDAVLDLVPHES